MKEPELFGPLHPNLNPEQGHCLKNTVPISFYRTILTARYSKKKRKYIFWRSFYGNNTYNSSYTAILLFRCFYFYISVVLKIYLYLCVIIFLHWAHQRYPATTHVCKSYNVKAMKHNCIMQKAYWLFANMGHFYCLIYITDDCNWTGEINQ